MQKKFCKKILLSNLIAWCFISRKQKLRSKNVRLRQTIDVGKMTHKIFWDILRWKKFCYAQKPHVECVQEADKGMFINIRGENILFQLWYKTDFLRFILRRVLRNIIKFNLSRFLFGVLINCLASHNHLKQNRERDLTMGSHFNGRKKNGRS